MVLLLETVGGFRMNFKSNRKNGVILAGSASEYWNEPDQGEGTERQR
ncbi:MAG: hypothetical protein JWN25_55 [Verrucomicrobiales bacterium]|nr:hypothetical protein [Verrucomicrobiales bacterium]